MAVAPTVAELMVDAAVTVIPAADVLHRVMAADIPLPATVAADTRCQVAARLMVAVVARHIAAADRPTAVEADRTAVVVDTTDARSWRLTVST